MHNARFSSFCIFLTHRGQKVGVFLTILVTALPFDRCHLCVTYTFHLKTDKVSAEAINCLRVHKESSILANVIHSLAGIVDECRKKICLLK